MMSIGKRAGTLAAMGLLACCTLLLLMGSRARSRTAQPTPAVGVQFEDVTDASGIHFRHHSGAYGAKLMPETVGSGVAFLDYDHDGWLDLLYVDSSEWPERHTSQNKTHPVLYRNLGNGAFADVTKKAGLDFEQYGMGVATGDFDNDGDTDLYLTAIGPNRLMRNRGDGTFEDCTAAAGVAGRKVEPGGTRWKWSSSASWVDYDRDGRLDLLVLNYVKWTRENDVWCGAPHMKAYCGPTAYEGVPPTLYHNRGDGTFEDVTRAMGLERKVGKGFGIATADYNNDGWPDLAIANDGEPNFLFLNRGGKRFEEAGGPSGIAVSDAGKVKAGMGIDCADWRNEGRFGLLIGNFARECLSLYRNEGNNRFTDEAYAAGLGDASQLFLTFGAFFFDFDNDGWQDAFAGNGHIDDFVNHNDSAISYQQRVLIFHNERAGRFREIGTRLGPAAQEKLVIRGTTYGDFDNDGDSDVALIWNNEKGLLWRNNGGNRNHWVGFMLEGRKSNRDGIGAVVRLTSDGTTQTQVRKSGGSFLSEAHPRLLFGLDTGKLADAQIVWPSGARTELRGLAADHYYRVVEGQNTAEPVTPRPPTSPSQP
jgi:hypothetical protein